jgi:type I restriction enzyme R subunit
MKLLIVVDKLLTGFDAPPATYLYIDKQMRTTACSRPSAA